MKAQRDRKSDVRNLPDRQAQHVKDRLNNHPRKLFGFLRPKEVFYEQRKLTG